MSTASAIHSRLRRTAFHCALFVGCAAAASAQVQRIDRLHEMLGAVASSQVIVSGDIDSDGDVDLFVHGPAGKNLFLNTGAGRFVLAANQPAFLFERTNSMALGDVDGDQDLDLLVGNGDAYKGGGDVQLRLNDGAGNFLPAAFPFSYFTTMSVAFGDTDGDGDLDVLAGNGADYDLWPSGLQSALYLNDGAGVFSDATSQLPVLQADTQALVLVDVDGDQDLDLVLANGGNYFAQEQSSRLYLNDGSSQFSDATAQLPPHVDHALDVVAGDIDGDSDADLIFGNWEAPRLYLNAGAGTFVDASGQLPQDLTNASGLALADFDADGDLDLIGVSEGFDEFLVLNDGNGAFAHSPSSMLPGVAGASLRPAVADFDGDLDLDCCFAGAPDPDRLRFNDGSGRLHSGPAQIPSAVGDGYVVVAGDLDSDSDLDLVLGHHVLINDGTGWFQGSDLPVVIAISALSLGDVDQDLDLDLFLEETGQDMLYLNDGSGAFSPSASQPPGSNANTHAIALADVDLDGDLDALLANFGAQTNLLLNDGTGVFTDASSQLPQGNFPTNAALFADFDGDGDPDLLLGNSLQPALLYLNSGNGHFTDASGQFPDDLAYARTNVAGDVDLDGDLDVLSVGQVFGQGPSARLYVNDGSAAFTEAPAQVPLVTGAFLDVELSDVDDDGDLDAWLMEQSSARLWLNDGQGTYHPSTAVPGPGGRLALGDFDLDGDDDACVAVPIGRAWMLSNLRAQLAWREIPRVGHPMTVDLYGTPGGGWVLIGARPHAQTPFPPYGLLQLERGSAFVIAQGPFDTRGRASVSIPIPSLASLVGATFYVQALIGSPRMLTNVEPVVLTGF